LPRADRTLSRSSFAGSYLPAVVALGTSVPDAPTTTAHRPPPLTVTERAAVWIGRVAGRLSQGLGRGAGEQIPGRVMLALTPRLSRDLARGRVVTLVSATNGKSTTTAMLAAALREHGIDTVTNEGGANMLPGIVTALASRPDATHAVLETDEAVLPIAMQLLDPSLVVLGSLSRDQLDRHHEVMQIAKTWRAAFSKSRARFVAPANDPNVVWSVAGRRTDWVDAETFSNLDAVVCPRCHHLLTGVHTDRAHWWCRCGLSCPHSRVVQRDDLLIVDDRCTRAPLALRGRWQHANRALAVTAATALGVPVDGAIAATTRLDRVGRRRQSLPTASGRRAPLVLVKNPAGWMATIQDLQHERTALLIVQNDAAPDGRDPSWLWDVPFEALAPRRVVASGTRALDVAVRIAAAGLDVVGVEPDPRLALARFDLPEGLVVAASYSAHAALALRCAS
jgi:UDP-N-acetylmuramyl tripeptide synthase